MLDPFDSSLDNDNIYSSVPHRRESIAQSRMYQRPDSPHSHQLSDIFLPTSTMFLGEAVRDAHPYRTNLDDHLASASSPFSTNQFQTSTSFSNTRNSRQQSLAGLSSHPSLFADANTTFSTTTDLFTPSHSMVPAHSDGLPYEYDQSLGQGLKLSFSVGDLGGTAAGNVVTSSNTAPGPSLPNGPFNPPGQLNPSMAGPLRSNSQQQLGSSSLQQNSATGVGGPFNLTNIHHNGHTGNPVGFGDRNLYSSSSSSSYSNSTSQQNANVNNNNAPSGTHSTTQEEISTIFVVGFPDDMQVRSHPPCLPVQETYCTDDITC